MKKEVGQLIAQRDNYLNLASQEVDQTVKDRYLKAARQLEEAIDLSSGEDAVFTPTPETISEYTPYIPKEYEKTVINGRPGKDGKDAVVDYDKIISTVTKKIKERPEKVVKIEKSLSEEEIEEIKESIKKDISYNDLKDIPLYRPAARDYDFLELKDVPKSYTGKAGKVLKVKTDEKGIEFADAASGTGDISGTGVANELAYFTAEKTIDNLPVATYPSLTELSYVKGVTSAIQTQLNGKQASGSYEVTTNKETSALDTSTTKYPCNNVVKEAVDAKAPSASPTFTGTVETPAIKITTGAGLGKVLTSDADGNGSWGTIPGGGDMLLATEQSVTGAKTFDKDKILMKGTSTGVTTLSTANASGTSYTITMPAATGTLLLSGGALGTPSAGTLTNCSGLPVSGITASTSTALGVGSVELGHASDTTLSRGAAGFLAVEGKRVPSPASQAAGDTLYRGATEWERLAKGTAGQVLTMNAGATAPEWAAPPSSFWTLMPGSPTRTSNTTFTITGDYTNLIGKGMVIKWTESSTVKNAMVSIASTYSSPNTTVTIIGDTMSSIDANSLKYAQVEARVINFAIAGTIGTTATDVANAYYAMEPMRVFGADLQVGTAGTTNNTTIDINKGGTTMFTTKPTLASTVTASTAPYTADNGTSLALNNKVTIDIDAVQSTPAVDLYVELYVWATRYNYLT